MPKAYKLMKAEKNGVKRQVFPETHAYAIVGLEKMILGKAPVLSVNGMTGNVVLTKESLGIENNGDLNDDQMVLLTKMLDDYSSGKLGGSAISFEKVEGE